MNASRASGIERFDDDGAELVKNATATSIAPWSAVELTTHDATTGLPTVTLPTAANLSPSIVRMTRGAGIPAGAIGRVYRESERQSIDGALPARGGSVGTVQGFGFMRAGNTGFSCVLPNTSTASIIPALAKQTITVACITGEIIPPYGAMETYTDGVGVGHITAICVRRPTAANLAQVLFNDGVQFNGGSGDTDPTWKTLTIEPLAPALVTGSHGSGTDALVGSFGTQANSYTLLANNTGFMCVGVSSSGGGALVRPFRADMGDVYWPVTLVGHSESGWDVVNQSCEDIDGEWGGGEADGFSWHGTKTDWVAAGYETPTIAFASPIPVLYGQMITMWMPYLNSYLSGINAEAHPTYIDGFTIKAVIHIGTYEQSVAVASTTIERSYIYPQPLFPSKISLNVNSGICVKSAASGNITGVHFEIDPHTPESGWAWNYVLPAAIINIGCPLSVRASVNAATSSDIVATCSFVWRSTFDCLTETWGDIVFVGYSAIDTPVADWELDQVEGVYTGTATCSTEENEEPDAPTIEPTCYYTWESEYDCATATWGTPAVLSAAFIGTVSTEWDIDEETGKATYIETTHVAPTVPEDEFTCYYHWRAAWDCATQAWTLTLESTALSGTESAWALDPYAYPESYICTITATGEPTPPTAPTCYFYWSVAYTCSDSSSGSFGTVTLMMVDTYGTASAWAESYNDGCNFYYECVTTSPSAPAVPAAPDCSGCI